MPDRRYVTFEVCKFFAGCWEGVVAVDDPSIIAGLDELVLKPKSGITRITEAEYKDALKKKLPQPRFKPLPGSQPSPPRAAAIELRAGHPAAVVKASEKGALAPDPVAVAPRVFESLDEVLKIGAVKPIEGSQEVAPPKKDMGERSARSRSTSKSRRPKYDSDPKPLIATLPP